MQIVTMLPMTPKSLCGLRLFLLALICTVSLVAQSPTNTGPTQTIACSSTGERQHCAADTSSGVVLIKSTGTGSCLLGRTWGYDDTGIWVSDGCGGEFMVGSLQAQTTPPVQEKKKFGSYTPGAGFTVADTDFGAVTIKLYTYIRYLNQKHLDPTYTDVSGNTFPIQLRQDFQVNKIMVYFNGWFLTPKLKYQSYVWSTNVSQGQSSQVVVAGNLRYTFNDKFILGFGISGLPGVRSTEGNFPYWLGTDQRPIADEFFRPSYTTGIFANGTIARGLDYMAMFGNNLSQFGVDAGELDNGLNTIAGALIWKPTTGEYGRAGSFGDFEGHKQVATRIGGHFTHSDENRQERANTNVFDNVQIRISDGTTIFQPNLLGSGVIVNDVKYEMMSLDGGVKYKGFSLEGEYYRRWLHDFRGPGTTGLPTLIDNGFQLQGSAMLRPQSLQVYASTSKVFGGYGKPWDARVGVNWFPWKVQELRWNFEYIQLDRSPVGGLSLPYPVGGTGPVFHSNFEVNF